MHEASDARPQSRYVEMLGLPGAGKSTLADMAADGVAWLSIPQLVDRERLRRRPLHRHRVAMGLMPRWLKLRTLTGPTPDAKDAAAFALQHRAFRDAVLRAGDHVDDRDTREVGVQLLFESWSEYAFAQRVSRPGDVVLLHEALLQRTAFLMAVVPTESRCATELLEALPLPDAVIILDIPLELAIARVLERGREFQMTEVMASMSRQIDAIAERIRTSGVPILAVRADRPPSTSLAAVTAFLQEQLNLTAA